MEELSVAKHYIIMSSSYTDGTRVALDITEDSLLNGAAIAEIIQKIRQLCDKDIPLSTHLIETDSAEWASVPEYDPFFKGVEPALSVEDFASRIKKGRLLSGLDVANYILTKVSCTHLSLEKLVYFAYADYLCSHPGRLFEDRIFAFTHGPVIESVYQTYKRSGYEYVQPKEDSSVRTSVGEMPARSRILFAMDGAEKLLSIDKTLKTYGRYTAGELVELTHRPGSPWAHVDSTKSYQVISDELIREYHFIECK